VGLLPPSLPAVPKHTDGTQRVVTAAQNKLPGVERGCESKQLTETRSPSCCARLLIMLPEHQGVVERHAD
jgi:hypothetical protein